MAQTICCPSGLSGEIRGLKVKEYNFLADRKLAKGGQQLDAILNSCWLSTTDPGPYAFEEDTVVWDKVLQGDRFYVLLQIRALSLGDAYAFSMQCQADACRASFEWEVNLSDLPVRQLPDEARETFKAGNRFEGKLKSGQRFWYRLALGSDERRFNAIRQSSRDRLWSAMLAMRVIEIDNVKPNQKRQFIEDLEVAEGEELRGVLDSHDCGVETGIEVECPECFTAQLVELPFGQGFFLQPRQRQKPATSQPLSSQM